MLLYETGNVSDLMCFLELPVTSLFCKNRVLSYHKIISIFYNEINVI